jgi:energy-coupling factor transporter ATP-binding protein EcfA2
MAAVIECRELTKRYRGITALAGLDLTVEAGQVFGFLGPNGAGKTTTLRILLGLVTATSGQAWLNGNRVPDQALLRAGLATLLDSPPDLQVVGGRRPGGNPARPRTPPRCGADGHPDAGGRRAGRHPADRRARER